MDNPELVSELNISTLRTPEGANSDKDPSPSIRSAAISLGQILPFTALCKTTEPVPVPRSLTAIFLSLSVSRILIEFNLARLPPSVGGVSGFGVSLGGGGLGEILGGTLVGL